MDGTDIFVFLVPRAAARARKRKGMSIVEALLLIVVVGITFGAIFSTMAWAAKNYAFSKQDKGSRELLFSWVQTFESLWPGAYADAADAAEKASEMLGGTWANGTARIGSFTLTAQDQGVTDGALKLEVAIRLGESGKEMLKLTRFYNAFSNETVSDDALEGGS
jgi:hypothetical protein